MRILHLYAGNLYGGIETILLTLAAERGACPGMEAHFGLCFEGRLASELRAVGVSPNMLGAVRLSRPWTVLQARQGLRRLMASMPPFDAVITHSCWPHAVFAPVVRRAGVPLIFWAHETYGRLGILDRLAGRVAPDRLIANSQFTASTIPALFPGQPDIDILYAPVRPPPEMDCASVRREIRSALACPAETPVIVMVARLEPLKGHALLFEAIGQLARGPIAHAPWQVWIAGGAQRPHESTYLAELRAQVLRLGIQDRVCFLGQRSDVSRLLVAADVFCQPNVAPESFGISLVEAMYAGLPVVTTRLGPAPEIVAAGNGTLVPPGDVTALTDALSRMLTDPIERVRLGAAGPARAIALCDPASQINHLYELLGRVTSKGQLISYSAEMSGKPSTAKP